MAAADTAPALGSAGWRRPRVGVLARDAKPRARKTPPPRLAPEAIAFQDDLEELIAEPAPPYLRGPHLWVALLFAMLLGLASIAEVDIVVTGSGRLAPDAPPLVLAPIERAVIRELRVRPGEAVARGQVLAVLDPTFADADRAALVAQHRALRAQLSRVEAEIAGTPLSAAADPDTALQSVLHAQRQAVHATRLAAFAAEIRGLDAGIASLEAAEGALGEQLAIARDVEAMRSRMLESQIGSRLQALGARSARLTAEQEQRQSRARLQELRHARLTRQADRQGFVDDWQRQSLEELVRLRGEFSRVEEQLAKANRLGEFTTLIAPQDGIVLEVARRSIGSVLREAEPLVTLVPTDAALIAEIVLRSTDIGHLRGGDSVVVKVDAFPYQRHGTLAGTLRAVAHESGNGGAPDQPAGMHRGQVALATPQLAHLPDGARIIPGMTLTAEIKVGTRSVIAFFLYPLLRGFSESIREP